MIQKVKIENFKSIQSLEMELGRLNVFIGANGCGKTNILEGIAMVSLGAERKLDYEFLSNRGIRVIENNAWLSGFSKQNEDNCANLSLINDSDEIYKIGIKNNINKDRDINVFSRSMNSAKLKDYFEKNNSNEISVFEKAEPIIKALEESFQNFKIFAPENHFLRQFESENQVFPLGIKGEGLFKVLADLIDDYPDIYLEIKEHLSLIDWYEGFEIPDDLRFTEKRIKITDHFLEDGIRYIDQRSANEGFLYLLFYFTLFCTPYTSRFFAIENIDNSLNPKLGSALIKKLAQIAKEKEKQAILTTHNPAILDGLDLSDDDQR